MTTTTRLPILGYRDAAVPNQFLRQDGKTEHLAIFLPGMGYTCDMPVFFYAQNLLEELGADILRVEYAYGHRPDFQSLSNDEQSNACSKMRPPRIEPGPASGNMAP